MLKFIQGKDSLNWKYKNEKNIIIRLLKHRYKGLKVGLMPK